MSVVQANIQPRELRCESCGATAAASCNCGVPYVRAGKFAAKVAAKHPDWSNGKIAAEYGLSDVTVFRARKSTPSNEGVEKTLGRDGRRRPAKKLQKPGKSKKVRKMEPAPSEEQSAYSECKWLIARMGKANRRQLLSELLALMEAADHVKIRCTVEDGKAHPR